MNVIAKNQTLISNLALLLFIAGFSFINSVAQALPDGFVRCAGENERCEFQGTKEVRYGADVRWKILTATNGINCDYNAFGGDPAYGTHKFCYIRPGAVQMTSTKIPGQARDIDAKNGSVWIIGTTPTPGGFDIYKLNGTTWNRVDGGAIRIAVDNTGNPWIINSAGSIFQRMNNSWVAITGPNGRTPIDIAISNSGEVWIVTRENSVLSFNNFGWKTLITSAASKVVFTPNPDTFQLVEDNGKRTVQQSADSWVTATDSSGMADKYVEYAVESDGTKWGIDSASAIWKLEMGKAAPPTKQTPVAGTTPTIITLPPLDLNGTWIMYDNFGLPLSKSASVAQSGPNVTLNNGSGAITVRLNGASIPAQAWGLTGTANTAGNRIDWSNGSYWSKQTSASGPASSLVPEFFDECASEGQICLFSGMKNVMYGAGGMVFYMDGPVMCTAESFSQPKSGSSKKCYVYTNPTRLTQSEQDCVNIVSGLDDPNKRPFDTSLLVSLQYLAYIRGEYRGRQLCSGTTAPWTTIACFTREMQGVQNAEKAIGACKQTSPPKLPDTRPENITGIAARNYTVCAQESGKCTFNGTRAVRYGAGDKWSEVIATEWFDCNTTAFGGDPAPGILKQCYVSTRYFNPWGYTRAETDCMQDLQETVAWRKSPDRNYTVWADEPLRALCKDTIDKTQTVNCFRNAIAADKNEQIAIRECAAVPIPAGRLIDFTVNDDPSEDQGVTPDEEDPLTVEVINNPLSPADLSKVMKWIADRTAANMSPYCYKQSYAREVDTLACPAGTERNDLLCYTPCPAGYTAAGPLCWQTCPSNFPDIGALCQKPPSYGRGAGYTVFLKDPEGDCKKDNPDVGCEHVGALWFPKCKPGFYAATLNICSPVCPNGMGDANSTCAKKSYDRGVGGRLSGCRAGFEQGGLLCYGTCKSGYYGNGSTCFQSCPATQPEACGAGCAKDKVSCGITTAVQVYSVINAVYSVATLGSSLKANYADYKAFKALKSGATVIPAGPGAAAAAQKLAVAANASRLRMLLNSIKRGAGLAEKGLGIAKNKATLFVGENAVEKLAALKAAGGNINKVRATYTGTARLVYSYSDQYASRFAELTSPEIDKEITSRFGPIGARQIKMEWARVNLSMMMGPNSFETAQTMLGILGTLDPTGILGVVSAFTHPLCAVKDPFPTVTIRYKD